MAEIKVSKSTLVSHSAIPHGTDVTRMIANRATQIAATAKKRRVCDDPFLPPLGRDMTRVVADVWEKDVWDFQDKSGSSGSCRLFLRFLGKIAVPKMSGKAAGSPRRLSSRHPRPSECLRTNASDSNRSSSEAAATVARFRPPKARVCLAPCISKSL